MATPEQAILDQYLRTLARKRQNAPSVQPTQIPVADENERQELSGMPAQGLSDSQFCALRTDDTFESPDAIEALVPVGSGESLFARLFANALPQVLVLTSEETTKAAQHLARAIINRFERVSELRSRGKPAQTVRRSGSLWWSRCPKGHHTDQYLWTRQCIAILCPDCLSIYEPKDCFLEARPICKPADDKDNNRQSGEPYTK